MSRLLADVPDLAAELRLLLKQIPRSRVTTYGDLARALGDAGAARWVGEYLVNHPHDNACCCHRVVRKGGAVGHFITGDPRDKITTLEREGIVVADGRVVLSDKVFTDFVSQAPLATLRDLQQQLPQAISLSRPPEPVQTVAGVDVSYLAPDYGVAAYVHIDVANLELLWSTTFAGPVTFPYITNYLTFRELPLFVRLFEEVRRHSQEADITLVDGNGILHPRRAGSASACGVAVETPTIGIGKKLLCGSVDLNALQPRQPRAVIHDAEQSGVAMKAGERIRPFFASPGHRVDMATTVDVVERTLTTARLPLPISLADRISRKEVKRIRETL